MVRTGKEQEIEIRRILKRFYRWEYFWLCLLLVVTLAMHLGIISFPGEHVLDEKHYITDALNIIENNETLRSEHPPLGKLFFVTGIKLLGDNPWGWRIFPVLFGTACIALFYFICRRLDMSRGASSIATFLLAFENMNFMMAGVAMLDVSCLFFMLLAFLLYLNRGYVTAGAAIGLSALAKLNGALASVVLGLHWLFSRKRSWWFLLAAVAAPLVFLALMPLFDLAIVGDMDGVTDPFSRIKTMMSLSGSLTFETTDHPAESRPWEWLLAYRPMAFWYTPHYTGAISFTAWALIIPAFAYMVYRAIKGNGACLFGAAWFAGIYLVWIPISIITDRTSYIYYFYPAVGAVCIGLGVGLSQLLDVYRGRESGKLRQAALWTVIIFLFLHLASFLILSPLIPYDYPSWVQSVG